MNEALFAQTSFVVLSAGSSVRMGMHKALLKYDADTTFIQKIVETVVRSGIEQVIVVVNSELFEFIKPIGLPEKVQLVINEHPERGRFYSLKVGVKLLTPGNACFFQNIDNPFTSAELLKELILHKDKADVLVPTFQKKSGHPVLISPLVVQRIYHGIDYEIRIDTFLNQFTEKKIEVPDPKILLNINSPDDYLDAGFMV